MLSINFAVSCRGGTFKFSFPDGSEREFYSTDKCIDDNEVTFSNGPFRIWLIPERMVVPDYMDKDGGLRSCYIRGKFNKRTLNWRVHGLGDALHDYFGFYSHYIIERVSHIDFVPSGKMGNFERSLRLDCGIADIYGLGDLLRGCLTGVSDQSRFSSEYRSDHSIKVKLLKELDTLYIEKLALTYILIEQVHSVEERDKIHSFLSAVTNRIRQFECRKIEIENTQLRNKAGENRRLWGTILNQTATHNSHNGVHTMSLGLITG